MKIVKKINKLNRLLAEQRATGKSIGFVPTMGALHAGHRSLVERCTAENDVCVVSIFVNPTQFNDLTDLEKYPRTLEQDCQMLEQVGAHIVFAPEAAEMYPEPDTRQFHFGSLETVMEGKFRTGHFNGVAQIVSKLFDLVQPDRAYFGEKDFQQVAIIRRMIADCGYPVQIVPCPTVREPIGLALSSRNERLTAEERKKAAQIAKTLQESRTFVGEKSVAETQRWVIDRLNSEPLFYVEYFELVDGDNLQPVENWNESSCIVGCVAVFCGEVRLIDNVKYKC